MSTLTLRVYNFLFNNRANYGGGNTVTGEKVCVKDSTAVAPWSQRRLKVAPAFDNRQESWWLATKCKLDESNAWETERVPVIGGWLIEGGAIAPTVLKKQDSFILASLLSRGDTRRPISTWHLEPPLGSLDCQASIIENMSGMPDRSILWLEVCSSQAFTSLSVTLLNSAERNGEDYVENWMGHRDKSIAYFVSNE